MYFLDALAERRIAEAQERGEFDGLPGTGAPLALDDDPLVPEELRVAYRMLKNAGFVPPELESLGEIRELEQLMRHAGTDDDRSRLSARVRFLLERSRGGLRWGSAHLEAEYFEQLAARLERDRRRE